jgi:tetratricopeptide (TPR) repeat protein
MAQDHYETLQVHPRADAAAIDAAYARLNERYDPANLEGAADELLELARARRDAIERAYAVLRDPTLRERYDAEQRAAQQPGDKQQVEASPVVGRQSPVVNTDTPLDYRPLPPARRQERAKGSAEPTLAPSMPGRAAPARPASRLAQRLTLPVTLGAVLALIITASLFVTGGGGPPAPTPTPTVSQFDIYESSIPQAQAFAEQNPKNAQAWIDLGNVLYDSAQIVREQAPESPVYQQRLGRWLQATNAYSQALALEPGNAPARADMGASSCFYGAGTGDQSFVRQGLAEVERAASAAPDDARVLLSMGHCLVSTAPPQTDEAIKTWQRIIDRNPSSPLVGQAQLLIAKYKR